MEELGIYHLDKKPENVLFRKENGSRKFLVETADFGGASDVGPPAHPVFSPAYMPYSEYNHPTTKTDVYQRGVILYKYMTNGKEPWPLTNRVVLPGYSTPSFFPNYSDRGKCNEKALIDQKVPKLSTNSFANCATLIPLSGRAPRMPCGVGMRLHDSC